MSITKTILIAEPREALSSQLYSALVDRGLNAIQASTLKETLLTLQSQSVDALVLDAVLLDEDCDFVSIIKGIKEDLPVIICAETNTPEFESKIRQQKIFYYHIKSFGTQDLEMAVSNAINKKDERPTSN
ncbi:MAG: hypothetical protein GY864_08490 [Desulfobacterales bacterium]|nr:hypothetical protein [Desulfobacterales bacterium]